MARDQAGRAHHPERTCNLYSITKSQQAIREALLQSFGSGRAKRSIGSGGLLRRHKLEPFADKLDGLNQSRGTEAKRALDDAGLASNVSVMLRADARPLRSARIISKPLIVA